MDDFTSLRELHCLHTLNVAHCQSASVAMATLGGCSQLHTLSLAGVTMDMSALQNLMGMHVIHVVVVRAIMIVYCTCLYKKYLYFADTFNTQL